MNEKMEDAIRVLNQLTAELLISCRSFDILKYMPETKDWSSMTLAAFNSTHMNSVILALCKWLEFYKEYAQVLPDNKHEENKELNKKLEKLKITEFRNKFIGHIKNKSTGRPLSIEEACNYYQNITNDNRDDFLLWLNNPSSSDDVMGLWESTRNLMRDKISSNNQSKKDAIPHTYS